MFFTVIYSVIILILLFIYLGKYNEKYWKKRGVVFYDRHKIGGPIWKFFISKYHLVEIFSGIYKKNRSQPAVGFGTFCDQSLFVIDPANVHYVTTANFNAYSNRGMPIAEEDILANNVVFLNGPKWKLLRQKLTPLFTGTKLKNMYYIIDQSAQNFVEFLQQNPDRLKGDNDHIYDTITHFCTDAISAAVFGLRTKSTLDSPIRKMIVDAVVKPTMLLNIKFGIGAINDNLYKALKVKLFKEHEDFFIGAFKEVMREREKENVSRHDFIDMCVNLQKMGTLHDPQTGFTVEPTDEVMAAQAFFFFIAGIDPSSAVMFATMMELGRHPDIQEKVHIEVDGVFQKYNNQLTYEAISELGYLDRVISEAMRMYPPLGMLPRQCVQDNVLPVGKIPVEKGVKIFIPVYDLQHDPEYYPNPEIFDPDRFSRGEVNDMTYLPFGKGNRYCLGARYARLQLLSGFAHFLRHFSVLTKLPEEGVKFKKESFPLRIKNASMEFKLRSLSK